MGADVKEIDCEHERAPDGESTCPDCGMKFVYCAPCTDPEVGIPIYHGEPACPPIVVRR